jgi:hypothetical protein
MCVHLFIYKPVDDRDFKETLEALSWPQPMRPPYGPQLGPKLKAFEKAFHNLLMLQDP